MRLLKYSKYGKLEGWRKNSKKKEGSIEKLKIWRKNGEGNRRRRRIAPV